MPLESLTQVTLDSFWGKILEKSGALEIPIVKRRCMQIERMIQVLNENILMTIDHWPLTLFSESQFHQKDIGW